MKTSKLLSVLSAIIIILASCSTPPERIIKYTTNDNCKIEFKDGCFGDAKLISNEFNKKEQCFYAKFDKELTVIGEEAFFENSALTSITIPNSVTSIGCGAFEGCSGLTSITIPNSVTTIGDGAFYGCLGLTSIEIPNNVTEIGEKAFEYCINLKNVTIPKGVKEIGKEAFPNNTRIVRK